MKKYLLIIPMFLLLNGCSTGNYQGNTAEEWVNKVEECQNRLSNYEIALSEANNNIEECNQNIKEAWWYAGSDYEDMENALGNLNTVDTINHPY